MVGLLYLPRLFVYHNDKSVGCETDTTLLIMEYRLLKYIMKPALILTYFFGFILIYENSYIFFENYFLCKIILVILLTSFHTYLSILYKDFKNGYRYKKTKYYRIINEIPTILMIIIIFLIIIKPDFQFIH